MKFSVTAIATIYIETYITEDDIDDARFEMVNRLNAAVQEQGWGVHINEITVVEDDSIE